MSLPTTISESTRRLNPQLFGPAVKPAEVRGGPRLRQNRGPKMNKTEAAFAAWFGQRFPSQPLFREAVTLKIGNGVRYSADFCAWNSCGRLTLYEIKGPHAWDDAIVKLKCAASLFAEIDFILASPTDRTKMQWKLERVFP